MKILLFGGSGQIGRELRRALAPLGEIVAPDRSAVDLGDVQAMRACVRNTHPALIVNAAAYTRVDAAEADLTNAFRINTEAPQALSQEASRLGAWLLHYSTDYVFDGEKTSPYNEQDRPNPLSVYGKSKLAGEDCVRSACARHLILRTGWVYALHGTNFPKTILRLARAREQLRVVADQFGTPTPAALVADLSAHALREVLRTQNGEDLAGTYHVAAAGSTSWYNYARRVLELAGTQGLALKATAETVEAVSSSEYAAAAARPHNACLDTSRFRAAFGLHVPDWRVPLADMIATLCELGSERECR